jgi:hypothetical protein
VFAQHVPTTQAHKLLEMSEPSEDRESCATSESLLTLASMLGTSWETCEAGESSPDHASVACASWGLVIAGEDLVFVVHASEVRTSARQHKIFIDAAY